MNDSTGNMPDPAGIDPHHVAAILESRKCPYSQLPLRGSLAVTRGRSDVGF